MFEVTNLIALSSINLGVVESTGSTEINSTNGGNSAIDLAPYINVGKRPVKVICGIVGSSSTTGGAPSTSFSANFLLYQCTSSNGTFAACSTSSTGCTLVAANTSTGSDGGFTILPTERWVCVDCAVTSTGPGTITVVAAILAHARAG